MLRRCRRKALILHNHLVGLIFVKGDLLVLVWFKFVFLTIFSFKSWALEGLRMTKSFEWLPRLGNRTLIWMTAFRLFWLCNLVSSHNIILFIIDNFLVFVSYLFLSAYTFKRWQVLSFLKFLHLTAARNEDVIRVICVVWLFVVGRLDYWAPYSHFLGVYF